MTPDDVILNFYLTVFASPNPVEDACPKFGRSSLLCFYEKAIGFFMPNKLLNENVQMMNSNPSKSLSVNEIIKIKLF